MDGQHHWNTQHEWKHWLLRHKISIIRLVLMIAVLILFFYQVSFNLARYLEKSTTFTSSSTDDPPPLFPQFTLCWWPAWHPRRLMGLNQALNLTTNEELDRFIYNFVGINPELTGEKLVREAAWRLEDMVESLEVGDIKETYDTSNVVSRLWRRSYTPLGPCMTLTAPPYASQHSPNLTIKLRPRPTGLELCKWVEDDRSQQYDHPDDCPFVQRYCNTSCAWQQYLTDMQITAYPFLSSTGQFIKVSGIQPELEIRHANIPNSVQVQPYRVILTSKNDPNIEPSECFHSCVANPGETKFKCEVISEKNLQSTIGSLCASPVLTYSTAANILTNSAISKSCLHYCQPKVNELRWMYKLEDVASYPQEYIKVKLSTPLTFVITEEEMYPLSQFLIDVGGSLGLFLGVSLLDLWMMFLSYLSRKIERLQEKVSVLIKIQSTAMTAVRLVPVIGLIILSMMLCVHFGIVVKTYMQQSEVMTVRLTASSRHLEYSTLNYSLESLLIGRLASRPFGCHIPSLSEYEECMVTCLLRHMHGDYLPFLSVQDLPICTAKHLAFPVLTYKMYRNYLQQIANLEGTNDCSACVGLNTSQKYYGFSYAIEEEHSYSILNILSNFGGLLGLYLGLSMVNIYYAIKTSKAEFSKRLRVWLMLLSKFVFVAAVTVVCTALCLLQVQEFLMRHPIYTTTSSQPLDVGDLPAVTVCMWPPVNIRRLLETAGLSTAYDQVALLSSKDRQAAVTRLLQQLPKTSNVTDPDHLWFASAWTDTEMLMDITLLFNNGWNLFHKSSMMSTIMNHCMTYQPHFTIDEPFIELQYQMNLNLPEEPTERYSFAISYLHKHGEPPVMEKTTLNMVGLERIEISAISRWNSLQSSGMSRSECVSRCLDDALVAEVGCRLPWVGRRHDLSPCNMTQFTHFLTALWRLGTQPRDVYKELLAGNTASECYFSCNHLSQTFYMIKTDTGGESITTDLSVGLSTVDKDSMQIRSVSTEYLFQFDVSETLRARDGYPLAQLVSDLGGIVGMTLGTSLISLLLTLISRMCPQREPGDPVG